IKTLETPCLLLDLDRLERNCAHMLARASALSVKLRPHLKTAKSLKVAALAVDGSRSLTGSPLKEGEDFAQRGYRDIVCAAATIPSKLAHAACIQAETGCDLILLTDALAVVQEAARFASDTRVSLSFLVEIDCGEHRSGLPPNDPAVVEVARAIE